MSALDQAIIKAYAKDRPAAATAVADRPAERRLPRAVEPRRAQAIEQLYHDGSLYHVEQPSGAARMSHVVPTPHLPTLPPTSPRRGVRRSMLRLLAANHSAAPTEQPPEPLPRIARKVIIRHISHSAAPPPLGMLRPSSAPIAATRSELPPEIIQDEPEPPQPALPQPLSPQNAPLNLDVHEKSLIEVRGAWEQGAAVSPMIIVAEPSTPRFASVAIHLDALSAAEQAAWAWAEVNADPLTTQEPSPSFATKSLEEREERIEIRVDAPHAFGRHRPHAKFAALQEPESPPVIDSTPAIAPAVEDTDQPIEAVASPELTFAEAIELQPETLVSDPVPLENEAHANVEPAAARPTVPLWEVDRFHWPRTCEKLFADENGYLARAGDKLLAAVQDGLRVLAVTGSRRGEGRSTLALCLARAAAEAGVQAAVMDADFARPQLASKIALEVAFGWQDAAIGRIPLSEAAVKSLADNVTLLPLESSAVSRTLSLGDPRVTATIRAAAATFELLILDLGPMAPGEQLAFPPGEACPLDAAIVVRDLRFATATESETIGHALQDAGVEAVGIAENFVIEEGIPVTSV